MLSARNIADGKINYNAYRFIHKDAFEVENKRTSVSAGDVLLTIVGTIGRTAVVPEDYEPFTLQRSVAVLALWSGIESRYLSHFLASPDTQEWLQANAKGSAQKGVYLRALSKLEVPVAPIPEQQRIVAKVDGLTARTARARKDLDHIPTLIARYKESLLTQIFENLDAVSERKSIRELSSFVTSGPRGWAKYYADSGDLFVRVGNVQRTDINLDLSDVQHVQPPNGAEGQRTRLQANDLLITITADIGRVGVFTDDRTAYINQHVALTRLDYPREAKFVAWYLSSEPGQVQLHRNTRGATKAGLGLGDIRDVMIPQVGIEAQSEVVRGIESAFGWLDRLAANHAAAERLLPKLDAAILDKAFRGELVLQDPNDEPASVLLGRIEAERAAAPKKKRNSKSKGKRMTGKKTPLKDQILADSKEWPATGLDFSELSARISVPYEDMRIALFDLLGDPSPILKQNFDGERETIVIQRIVA
ncbi:MAG: hypothetical protein Pars2KO_32320 [Parasphingorhabdus sp.]